MLWPSSTHNRELDRIVERSDAAPAPREASRSEPGYSQGGGYYDPKKRKKKLLKELLDF